MTDPTNQDRSLQPWDQQPGEPDYWYKRFKVYLQLGPLRTYRAAYNQVTIARGHMPRKYTPTRWSSRPNRWNWRERAQAWDVYQRNLLAISERNSRLALRQRRVGVMEDALETIRTALDTADIASADQALARQWLPQLRVFLRDMLVAERQEFERLDYERDDPGNTLMITADDLRAAQREMEKALPAPAQPVAAAAAAPAAVAAPAAAAAPAAQAAPDAPKAAAGQRILMVCTGPDSDLTLDLAALRAVRATTGLCFTRVINATRRKFTRALRMERRLRRPIELLHMALHASPEGVQFADGVADSNWLSERLLGVRVLLLAACESDGVGEWLGVVPHVISLSEEIASEDAATFTQYFWNGIGAGLEPGEALDAALEQCPPVLGEFVVRHW